MTGVSVKTVYGLDKGSALLLVLTYFGDSMTLSREFGIAIVGCGTVGNATALLLNHKKAYFHRVMGRDLTIKHLVSLRFGKAREAGLDEKLFVKNFDTVLADNSVHLIVETVGGMTEARTIVEKALKAKKHVVTANKALLAHHGNELFAIARENGVSIGFEASCAGGIPIIRALVDGLLGNSTDAIYGIVNGTSNFILTEMVERGKTYAQALSQAQKEGLAEADPTLDVNGVDAAHKLTLLASLAFGGNIPFESIPVDGIDGIDLFDVRTGDELGYVLKLVAFARKAENGLETAVKPVFLPKDHPLALVAGPFNAISVYGDTVGHTMYYGRGAGGNPTASAVVSDILSIAMGTWPVLFDKLSLWPDKSQPIKLSHVDDSRHRHYLRFDICDQSGVVAEISTKLAKRNISLKSFIQKEYHKGDLVPIVLTTHEARVKDINEAFMDIIGMPEVGKDAMNIRIIDEHAEIQ